MTERDETPANANAGDASAAAADARGRSRRRSAAERRTPASAAPKRGRPAHDKIDASVLESLVGYNARRAAVTAMGAFIKRMATHDLRPLDFSVLSLIAHNPGITSRQLCKALEVLPPNLVGVIAALTKRKLVERLQHPEDRRAATLHLTESGKNLIEQAEVTAAQLEAEVAHRLTAAETRTLIRLLKKIYR